MTRNQKLPDFPDLSFRDGDRNAADPADALDPAVYPELYDGVAPARALAYLIDAICIALLIFAVGFAFTLLSILSLGILSPIWLIFPLIPLAYHSFFVGGPHSATIGMRVMNIEVRLLDGRRPDYLLALLHTILFYASISVTAWLIVLVALFNRRGQCVHDFLLGTVVIRNHPALAAQPKLEAGGSGRH
ncbi:RDD family protein [Oceanibacterium hippocampi]|uniref:RDD family protein n=1 Tax=Oceanibacterium hippocampi TaxID=745714 RepID=A0A1Y5SMY3_9PROT|nr:RDD family protein [Oceanibacterium hippocampi]SLN44437.1 RDD family protein [Oceanibacterium hippocampi]